MMAAAATLLALAAVAAAERAPSDPEPQILAQLVVRQGVIVRVPTRQPAERPRKWREKKGPKCIPADGLAGAMVSGPDTVDLLLRGGKRVRAELESRCPALDYYSGFYIRPGDDGRICQDRDVIRSRSGGKCGIDRFRSLVPGK